MPTQKSNKLRTIFIIVASLIAGAFGYSLVPNSNPSPIILVPTEQVCDSVPTGDSIVIDSLK